MRFIDSGEIASSHIDCCSTLSYLLSVFGLELNLGELPAKHSCNCRAKWNAREAWDVARSAALWLGHLDDSFRPFRAGSSFTCPFARS